MTPKEKYFHKKLDEAPIISCACGCGQELKAVDNYARPRKFINGHNTRKYDDPKQFKREWDKRNRKSRYELKKKTFHKKKVKLLMMFGSVCNKCGVTYNGTNAAIFHFHHLRDKSFALGNQLMNKAWSKILDEAAKCILLCANCHELQHSAAF
jgi:hypothetical protein